MKVQEIADKFDGLLDEADNIIPTLERLYKTLHTDAAWKSFGKKNFSVIEDKITDDIAFIKENLLVCKGAQIATAVK